MAKQPYIQFYLGDYIKDTRVLPLNVKGGCVDLILAMWDNTPKGEIIGTIEDFARIMNCPKDEAVLVIQTLKQKKIFDYEDLPDDLFKFISRKQKRMEILSEIRKTVGKTGGNPNLVNQNKTSLVIQKDNQKPEYENEYENKDLIKKEIEKKIKQPKKNNDVAINAMVMDLTPQFNEPAFFEAWAEWWEGRAKKKHPLTHPAAKLALKKLNQCQDLQHAIKTLEYSTLGGYPGLYPESQIKNQSKTGEKKFSMSTDEEYLIKPSDLR